MYTDYYGLSFNPFDKQMVKEKDAFESEDFREMTARLEYLKEIRGIGVFTASPGMGKTDIVNIPLHFFFTKSFKLLALMYHSIVFV